MSCLLDHQAKDDPIVFFGQPFASHFHDFFGAHGVDAFTTADELRSSGTTCGHSGDTAAYWAPSVVAPDGTVVQPTRILAYYQAPEGMPVRAMPHGLKMVAGGEDPGRRDPVRSGPVPADAGRLSFEARPAYRLPFVLGRREPGQPRPPLAHVVHL